MTPRPQTSIFGEALFGYVHGFDSVFPTSTTFLKATANAMSMQIGGGLNIGVAKYFGIRAPEIYYVHTNLPDNLNDVQNDLRLGFGVSYHIAGNRSASKWPNHLGEIRPRAVKMNPSVVSVVKIFAC